MPLYAVTPAELPAIFRRQLRLMSYVLRRLMLRFR